jgi:hypothetical protein
MRFEQEMRLRLLLAHDVHMQKPPHEIFPMSLGKGQPGTCFFCGRPIPVKIGGKEKKFCTSRCKEKHRRATR